MSQQNIDLIKITELPEADAELQNPVMFGIGDLVHITTLSQIKELLVGDIDLNGTKITEVVRTWIGGTGSNLTQAAASINAGASFNIPANHLGMVSFLSGDTQTQGTPLIRHTFLMKVGAGTYGSGGTTLNSSNLKELAPVFSNIETVFELGNIGNVAIESFVNTSGAYVIQDVALFRATQDGIEKEWLFIGGAGTWGDGAQQTNAEMFVDLADQDPIPVELSTLHNTIIGGVGGTITNKVLLAAQLTGVSADDISNFYLDGLDVYAQINKDYTDIGTGIRTTLTNFIDRENRSKVTNFNWGVNTNILSIKSGSEVISSSASFERFDNLTTLDLRNVKTISVGRFCTGAGSLTSLNLDSLERITAGDNQFYNLSGSPVPLVNWSFPKLKSVNVSVSGFRNLTSALTWYTPLLESYIGSSNNLIFGNLTKFYAPNLKVLDIASGFSGFASGCTITVHSDLSTANAGQEHAALATARAAGATIVYHQTVPTGLPTGTEIRFITPQIYNTATTPATGNITNDLTGALQGVVQKIYHNHTTEPTVPAGWVLMGAGTYVENELNIIYAEYAGGSRAEYWIVNEA